MDIFGDELDFLGLYLATSFNIWSIEAEKPKLIATGMSQVIDRDYNNRDAGIASEKPSVKLHPYFASLIHTMEKRAFPGWLGISIDLLQIVSYEEQKEFVRLMSALKTKVQANWCNPEHECSIVATPPGSRDVIFVFYLFPETLVDRRKETAKQLISKALSESNRPRGVLISRCIDRWDDPYSFIVTASHDAETKPAPIGGLVTEVVANT